MYRRLLVGGLVLVLCLAGSIATAAADNKTLPLQLDASAGFGFDSNVPSRPMDDDEDTSLLRFGKGDFFYEHNLTVGYTLPVTSELSILAQYALNQNFHFRLTQYDFFSNNISVTPVLRLFNNTGQLTGFLNYNYLDISSDKYRSFYTARPVYYQMLSDLVMLEASVGFERRYYYVQVATPRDIPSSKNLNAFLGMYLFLNKNRSAYILTRYTFDHNDATGSNWDYNGHRFYLAGFFPIVDKLKGNVYLDIYRMIFNNPWFDAHRSENPVWLFFNPPYPKRRDTGVTAGAQLNYEFYPRWSAQTNLSYTRNNSNIKWYQYERFLINVLLTFKY